MSSRLNQEREKEKQPERLKYAISKIIDLGYVVIHNDTMITFDHKGESVIFYPYSGWHTGKSIKDGRGLKNLLNQLKQK